MMKKEFKQLKKKGKLMKSMSKGVSEAASEKMGLMQKKGKLATKQSMKKVARPIKKKRTMTDETKMKAPYKRPVGPRAE